jgi:hypothetical protein
MSEIHRLRQSERGAGQGGPDVAAEILRAVKEVRFGSVEIIIHDSRVVQVERREKVRFPKAGHGEPEQE